MIQVALLTEQQKNQLVGQHYMEDSNLIQYKTITIIG